MDSGSQRSALAALVEARGETYAALSKLIGRNSAYLQQFVTRGSPRQLAEADRAKLARYLGVAETELGGAEPAALVEVTRLDVRASAGRGALVEGEAAKRPGQFDPALLRQLGVRPAAASMIRVQGDSMDRTLSDGDEILVDRDRRTPAARDALFVLRIDGTLMVKRLRAMGGQIEVASDNPAYETRLCDAGQVDVVGRVVWLGRSLL